MKYRLNEEQLNSLIAESTARILNEAMQDEGFGKWLGQKLGGVAGKARQGLQDFGKNFKSNYQQNFTGGTQGNNAAGGNQGGDKLGEMQQLIQQLSKEVSNLQKQQGAAQPQNVTKDTNGGNSTPDATAANGGNGGNGKTDTPAANGGNGGNDADSSQNSMANLMRNSVANGNMEEAVRKRKKQISEAQLKQIVSETIRKVLKEGYNQDGMLIVSQISPDAFSAAVQRGEIEVKGEYNGYRIVKMNGKFYYIDTETGDVCDPEKSNRR